VIEIVLQGPAASGKLWDQATDSTSKTATAEPAMRQERTRPAYSISLPNEHEIGRELKTMLQWLDEGQCRTLSRSKNLPALSRS
jgi:hypothetical protein